VKTVCYLAHCLLNANAKVDAGARCEGVSAPVVALLREHDCTIRQMPCPELAFGGLRRFWAVREQYDTPVFRAHCRRLATPIAQQIRADLAAGARVVIVGIDGSPTMGVELTAASEEWGGRPDKPRDEDYPVSSGRGLFTETLIELLGGERPHLRVVGLGQDLFGYDEARELEKVGRELSGTGMGGAGH
jgi:predicted secreted protein